VAQPFLDVRFCSGDFTSPSFCPTHVGRWSYLCVRWWRSSRWEIQRQALLVRLRQRPTRWNRLCWQHQ